MIFTYLGLIEFPEEFLVNGEALGKQFVTCINGVNAAIVMPVIDSEIEEDNRNLRSPFRGFEFEIDWGYIVHSKTKDSFVKAAVLLFQGKETNAQEVYSAFPNWLYRFMVFIRALSHDLIKEFTTEPIQVHTDGKADKYTGLTLYKMIESKMSYEYNKDNIHTVHLDDSMTNNPGLSIAEITDIMKYAASMQPISQGAFLLSEAAIAYQRGDCISCVVLSSVALEEGIVERVNKYCRDNHISFPKMGPLGKKFKILTEYGIDIPIKDYRSRIVIFRNNVVHQADRVSGKEARRFWKDCQLLMREFGYSMVSRNAVS